MANMMRARQLLSEMVTVSSGLKDYNFRHYFVRRTNIDIQKLDGHAAGGQDTQLDESVVKEYEERLEQLKRIQTI